MEQKQIKSVKAEILEVTKTATVKSNGKGYITVTCKTENGFTLKGVNITFANVDEASAFLATGDTAFTLVVDENGQKNGTTKEFAKTSVSNFMADLGFDSAIVEKVRASNKAALANALAARAAKLEQLANATVGG